MMGKSLYILTLRTASLSFLFSQPGLAAEVVVFLDPGLDAAVRQAINTPTGDILDTDLVGSGFASLDASNQAIEGLTGLEHCTDLTWLKLDGNEMIFGLVPLGGLTNLTTLYLDNNPIVYVLPLAAVPGVGLVYSAAEA